MAVVVDPVAGALVTMEVESRTGALKTIASTALSDFLPYGQLGVSYGLTADPLGRVVYVAIGNQLVSYVPDKSTGRLAERSQVVIDPQSSHGVHMISASERQVHGVFEVGPSMATRGKWIAFQADPITGTLSGRACFGACDITLPDRGTYGPTAVVPDAAGRFVYIDGWITSAVQPDGSLIDVRTDGLFPPLEGDPLAQAIGAGFLAISDGSGLYTAAIDPVAGRLSPRLPVVDALPSSTYSYVPSVAVSASGFIALAGGVRALHDPWTIQTWHVDDAGRLDRRAEISLPEGSSRYLAFDPSGRFLYVSGLSDGIRAFAVAADGGLLPIGSFPSGSGPIVVVAR